MKGKSKALLVKALCDFDVKRLIARGFGVLGFWGFSG